MITKNKTLVVLGGSGFIGKSILSSFLKNQLSEFKIKKIILVSRNIEELKKTFEIKNDKRIILKKMDLSNTQNLPMGEYILHAAEQTIYGVKNKNIFLKYFNLTKKICKFYEKFENIKFLYLSSGAVYGRSVAKIKFSENSKINTNNLSKEKKEYAKNKIKSEKLLLKKFKLPNIIIARLFTFIGKHIEIDKNYAAGNFVKDISNSKFIKIKSTNPKKVYRSYLYSDNLVNCLLNLLVFKNKSNNCIYNVGSSDPISIYGLATKFSKISNKKIQYKEIKNSRVVDYYVPNIDKIKKNYKLKKFRKLESSILRTVK